MKVPDIGDYTDVPVIEISVKVGDKVEAEQSLITLESDTATMDVPSPAASVVKEIRVKVGDAVSCWKALAVLPLHRHPHKLRRLHRLPLHRARLPPLCLPLLRLLHLQLTPLTRSARWARQPMPARRSASTRVNSA